MTSPSFRLFFVLMALCAARRGAMAQRVSSPTAHEPATIVFVCEHGTVKSVVALEHFNHLARARGLDIVGISRGTRPDSIVPDAVSRGLSLDGFDVSLFSPRRFTSADLTSAILVVALDADVAPVVANSKPIVRWDGLPSVMSNYDNGRRAIVAQVEKLVDSLARSKRPRPDSIARRP